MSDIQNKIKCVGCNKHLMALRFSESAKKRYRDSLARNQRDPKVEVKYPRCLNCSPGNVQELKCCKCDRTMGLDRFAKNQRKVPDEAHCLDCQQERVDREAVFKKEVEENEIIEEQKNQLRSGTSQYSSAGSSILGSRFSRMSMDDQDDRYETETNPGSDWGHGNTALSFSGRSSAQSETWSERGQPKSSTGWHDLPGSARSTITTASGKNDFAKQKAVPKTIQEKARDQLAREENRRQQDADDIRLDESSSDDDDDDDAPY